MCWPGVKRGRNNSKTPYNSFVAQEVPGLRILFFKLALSKLKKLAIANFFWKEVDNIPEVRTRVVYILSIHFRRTEGKKNFEKKFFLQELLQKHITYVGRNHLQVYSKKMLLLIKSQLAIDFWLKSTTHNSIANMSKNIELLSFKSFET